MIYFDSAATTLQKPASVPAAVADAIQTMTTPGRGDHPAARLAADLMLRCRMEAAELFEVPQPENVILTSNATHGLNIAIRSLVSPGDTVAISGYEHNAVTRPLQALGCRVKVARGPLFEPEVILARFKELITDEVSCVVCTHVSNVFGYVLPVEEIARLCKAKKVPFILDASQSAGVLPVHMDQLGAAFIAMPGHKGLYGPQGTGLLLCAADRETHPLLEGGTGSLSARQDMPDFLPDRLEAGTHNIPGIAGLLEGLRYVSSRRPGDILRHEQDLTAQAVKGLSTIPGVTVYAAKRPEAQAGVLSFTVDGIDCESVGEELGQRDVAVRAGLHCAPRAHETAGTLGSGTVRASFSDFNTPSDIRRLVTEIARLAG